MTHHHIFIAGKGGQGISFMGQILLKAAIHEGKYGEMLPHYEYTIRGGLTTCHLLISDHPQNLSQHRDYNIGIYLHPMAREKTMPFASDSLLIDAYALKGPTLTQKIQFNQGLNMLVLGYLLKRVPICHENMIAWALKQNLGPDRIKLLTKNLALLEKGGQL